jgi:phenylalanyl-tRNA synthetase beta subunit
MDEEEWVRQIAREAGREVSKETVKETLSALGFDVNKPQEAQAMMQTVRSLHEAKQKGGAALIWITVLTVVGGVFSLIGKAIFKGGAGS